jgi:SAM-dependent methyltransferase
MAALLSAMFFPWSSDSPLTAAEQTNLQKFYATAYDKQGVPETNDDTKYVKLAEAAANRLNVTAYVTDLAKGFGLKNKKVLDIGAGRGYLQDVVEDYTALDISPSVKRFFHKPFVLASATLMPFPPGQFDSAWTVWVLEHVPNPEASLVEMRRVVKDGGLIYLTMPGRS